MLIVELIKFTIQFVIINNHYGSNFQCKVSLIIFNLFLCTLQI